MGGQDQVGIYPTFQLGIHDHLDDDRGGILNAYSRDGAFRKPYRTGALAVFSNNPTERSTVELAYIKLKEIKINAAQPGRYVISWQFRGSTGVDFVYSRFYRNGVAVSTERSTLNTAYVTETHNYDVDLPANVLLQIYGYADAGTLRVRNFGLKYDWGLYQFGDGGRANLVTLLPLSSVDLLDFTNQDP